MSYQECPLLCFLVPSNSNLIITFSLWLCNRNVIPIPLTYTPFFKNKNSLYQGLTVNPVQFKTKISWTLLLTTDNYSAFALTLLHTTLVKCKRVGTTSNSLLRTNSLPSRHLTNTAQTGMHCALWKCLQMLSVNQVFASVPAHAMLVCMQRC